MTKILLTTPIFSSIDLLGKNKGFENIHNIIPPLGIAYIAAYLRKSGHDIRILDFSLDVLENSLDKVIKEFSPHIIGISCTTPLFHRAIETVDLIQNIAPKIKTIIGGSHVSALPKETMELAGFDIGVLGEGEATILDLAENYVEETNSFKNLKKIKGIIYRDKNRLVITGIRPLIKDLDSIPFPARDLLPPLSKYKPTPASYRSLPLAHVMTSRGCPTQCNFCDKAIFGSSYRERSTQNVLDEVDMLRNDYGIEEIKFFDDTFTLNKKRLAEICKGMAARKISWSCLTKVDAVDYHTLKLMKKSGCWQVLFGLESGDKKILKYLNKGTTLRQNRLAVRLAHKVGLSVRADFLIGSPLETKQSILKTFKFAKELNIDFAHFNKFNPYPGTKIYKELLAKGHKFDFTKNCGQLNHENNMYSPESIEDKELFFLINKIYKGYYFRPVYLFSQFLKIRSITDIKRLFTGAKALSQL